MSCRVRIGHARPAPHHIQRLRFLAPLQGRTFGDVRRCYRDCIALGMMRSGTPLLEGVDHMVMQPDDKLVVIAHTSEPAAHARTPCAYRGALRAASTTPVRWGMP